MVTIYYNPSCGTSRNTLAMIRTVGIEPTVIEYLKMPPSHVEIKKLVRLIGEPLRSLIREKGTPFHDLGLGRANISDDELLEAIGQHPVLLNRPIVVIEKGAALCRPSERVLDLLPQSLTEDFVKEDGEIVRVGGGNPS
ncbi:MAG: arsenate reductase (glutaredoxin) [Alphaproteobacteria bacterium]|nr:arsenate reductase (glutaredoxin) [Alphaproteobacteria bacterium]